jgi:hypothetical protein
MKSKAPKKLLLPLLTIAAALSCLSAFAEGTDFRCTARSGSQTDIYEFHVPELYNNPEHSIPVQYSSQRRPLLAEPIVLRRQLPATYFYIKGDVLYLEVLDDRTDPSAGFVAVIDDVTTDQPLFWVETGPTSTALLGNKFTCALTK